MLRLKLRTLIHYLLNDEEKKKKSNDEKFVKSKQSTADPIERIEKIPDKKKQKKTEKINRKTFLKTRKNQED